MDQAGDPQKIKHTTDVPLKKLKNEVTTLVV